MSGHVGDGSQEVPLSAYGHSLLHNRAVSDLCGWRELIR